MLSKIRIGVLAGDTRSFHKLITLTEHSHLRGLSRSKTRRAQAASVLTWLLVIDQARLKL